MEAKGTTHHWGAHLATIIEMFSGDIAGI